MFSSVSRRTVYYLIIFMIMRGSTSSTYCSRKENKTAILETCDNLSAVKIIEIKDIQFNTFNHSVFARCNSTIDLDLLNVSLSNVSPSLFKGMTSLQTLNLNDNLVRTLNNESFGEIPNLRVLFLNNNVISSIAEDSFKNLSNLRYIYVRNNSIGTVDRCAFPADNHLKHLDFTRNYLKDLNFVRNLTRLRTLYLPFNEIETLEKDVFLNLVDLEYLDLKYNLIEELPINLFKTQKRLNQIDLAHNRLVQIETGTFNIGFRDLLLNDNRLTIIAVLNNISEVNIERNCLEQLPALPVNNVTLFIDENPWECKFIHQLITYHPNINLEFTPKDDTKNLHGIPCKDTFYKIENSTSVRTNSLQQLVEKNDGKIIKNSQHFWGKLSLCIVILASVISSLILMIIIYVSCRKEERILPDRTNPEERKYLPNIPANNSTEMETGYLTPILSEHIYEEIDHYTESPV